MCVGECIAYVCVHVLLEFYGRMMIKLNKTLFFIHNVYFNVTDINYVCIFSNMYMCYCSSVSLYIFQGLCYEFLCPYFADLCRHLKLA